MKGITKSWEKLGRILAPDVEIEWMSTFTGASFAVPTADEAKFEIYVTGRDQSNRSLIGRCLLDVSETPTIISIDPSPTLDCGSLGAFDENGVSYPCLVNHEGQLRLYYTGWMPTVLTPFQNHLGLAIVNGEQAKRFSRAPILERTHEDYLSTGSVCVQVDNDKWKMWYTSFIYWGEQDDSDKHRYVIKYATSDDGIRWVRNNEVCIGLMHDDEHSICRPTIYKHNDLYHMWYCFRGEHYHIGYAFSEDGISWNRQDNLAGITGSSVGWDSLSQSYPNVFRVGDYLYMLYCGNHYGRDGLGLARLKL